MEELDPAFVEGLKSFEGKVVKVTAKCRKSLDAEPGASDTGYYLADYVGQVLSPALRHYPENNQNGVLCLYIQATDVRKQVYAIAVTSITEVDDEIEYLARPVRLHAHDIETPRHWAIEAIDAFLA